jgi:biotin carboxylase
MPDHLIVLGADPGKDEAFAAFQRGGMRVTLVTDEASSTYQSQVDHTVFADPTDDQAADRTITATGLPVGIITLADRAQLATATAAERHGLPGVGVAAGRRVSSKLLQRVALRERGLPSPLLGGARSSAEAVGLFGQATGPVVMKPVGSSASIGIHFVDTAVEAAKAFEQIVSSTGTDSAVVEEFVIGAEVSVEAVVIDGAVVAHSLTEKQVSDTWPGVELSHLVRSGREQKQRFPAARAELAKVIEAMEVRSAVVHAEFKVDGPQWTLIEIAARIGGGRIPWLTSRVTGLDLHAAIADLAFGREPDDAQCAADAAGTGVSAFLARPGLVRRSIDPIAACRDLPGIAGVQQLVAAGRRVREPLANWGRVAAVSGLSRRSDSDDLELQVREALSRIEKQLFE